MYLQDEFCADNESLRLSLCNSPGHSQSLQMQVETLQLRVSIKKLYARAIHIGIL